MSEIKHYEVLTDFEMEEIAPNEWCLKKFIGFDPSTDSVEIPSEIDGKRIVTIGAYLFKNNKGLYNVKIGDGIRKIANDAFNSCSNLKSIVLPTSLCEIAENALSNSNLIELVMPDSITKIGARICAECHELKFVCFSKCLSVISEAAFRNCNNLNNIDFPSSITEIREHAFYRSGICSLVFPEHLSLIGDFAFSETLIESLILPPTLTTVGEGAFKDSSVKSVFIPQSVKTIGESAFGDCQHLTEIVLERNSQVDIKEYAFSKHTKYDPRMPKDISDTSDYEEWALHRSFYKDEILEIGQVKCYIPASIPIAKINTWFSLYTGFFKFDSDLIESVYQNTFIFCEKGSLVMQWARKHGLKCGDYYTNLPEDFKNIITAPESPENATTEMPSVSDESTPPVIETSEIADINDTKKQNSTSTVEAVSEVADENNDATLEADNTVEGNSVDIEEAVEEESDICEGTTPVDPWAIFDYEDTDNGVIIKMCKDTSLQKVIVPDGVVEIGMKAFYAMENLEEVVLPEGLLYIGADAFHNCKKLSAVTLPQSLTKIGRSAFLGCRCSNEYKQFVIPENVVEIAPFALPQSLLAFKNKENWVRLDAISRKEKMMGKIPSDKLKFADKARDLYQKYNQDIWKRNK